MNIAIDGPAGAGKSTIAKKAAGELGFYICGYRCHVQGGGCISHRKRYICQR